MLALSRRTALSCAAAALTVSACANVSGGNNNAPAPAKALPAPIASDLRTDLGEYLATPRAGISSKDVQATIDQLRSMPGVQSAELKDGKVDVQFFGHSTSAQRTAAVKQLAALGTIEEGI
ncbi:MAG: hypothetical protein JWP11_3117 [Frankiales bacterium]|nr:hypothetical protein [Frankiales bacterium]